MSTVTSPFILELTFFQCMDFFIFATDATGTLWLVDTSRWPEWQSIPGESPTLPAWCDGDATAKYMLPIALKRWDALPWRRVGGA